MPGRPPSTVEGEVRAVARRLRGPSGVMLDADRLAAMTALFAQVRTGVRYGRPGREALVRLAAHCIAWAEDLEDDPGEGAA